MSRAYRAFVAQDRNRLTITGGRGAPQGITTVVFDFDDTIADTLPAREDALRRTFETAGIKTLDVEEYMRSQRGVPLQVALDAFDNGRGAEMGLLDIYRTAYWHRGPGLVSTYEGVSEMLDGLLAAGMRMGVLTSKARDIDTYLIVLNFRRGPERSVQGAAPSPLYTYTRHLRKLRPEGSMPMPADA